MKAILSVSTSLVILLFLLTVNGEDEDFCDSEEIVSRAFSIGGDIYFGDDSGLWKFNSDNKQISKKQSFGQIFGENIGLKTITTAVYFGQIECQTNCEEIRKSRDLALVVGYMLPNDPTTIGYKAYKISANMEPTAVEDDLEMPWQLKTEARLFGGSFWVQDVVYQGMTFDPINKTIYMASGTQRPNNLIYSRKINDQGVFDDQFSETKVNRVYTGLLMRTEEIFGLNNNQFFHLSYGHQLGEDRMVPMGIKSFFHCKGFNGSLNHFGSTQHSGAENTTSDSGEGLTQESEIPEDYDVSKDSETTVDSTQGWRSSSSTSTTPTPESGSNWFIWVIVVVLIVIVIIALIVCCLLFGKKSNKTDVENKSKADSKIASEGASEEEMTKRSSGGSASGGSERITSKKSDIEAQPSVRSKMES